MNATHLHLMLNHVAIMAAIFSALVFGFGWLRKNTSIIHVGLVGFVVAALTAIPVFLTGEPAEESVEHIPGIVETVIEQHEESAELALWIIEVAGVLAFTGLAMRANKFFSSSVFYGVLLVVSVASAASIAYTGYLGGQIRHTELGIASSANGTTDGAQTQTEGDDD